MPTPRKGESRADFLARRKATRTGAGPALGPSLPLGEGETARAGPDREPGTEAPKAAAPSSPEPGAAPNQKFADPLEQPLPGASAFDEALAEEQPPDEFEVGKKKAKVPSPLENWQAYGKLLARIPMEHLRRDREKVLRTLVVYPARPVDPKKLPTTVEVMFERAVGAAGPSFTKAEREFLYGMPVPLAHAFYTNLVIGRVGRGTEIDTARGSA
jgi:hypothetical protein